MAGKIPQVELGDLVYWFPDGDKNAAPHPAFVTALGEQAIQLSILHADRVNFTVRDGVMHVSDPRCGNEFTKDSGAWDLSPQLRRAQQMQASLLAAGKQKQPA